MARPIFTKFGGCDDGSIQRPYIEVGKSGRGLLQDKQQIFISAQALF